METPIEVAIFEAQAFEGEKLAKRKGPDGDLPMSPREGRRDLRRENGCVGTGDENPDVLELVEAIEPPLLAGNSLDLVEEEVL
ncbi:MAG: hypothetical protein AABY92_06885, partial [Thermodesulfobacteriota bacterium]